jgi:hypothetical protein
MMEANFLENNNAATSVCSVEIGVIGGCLYTNLILRRK